MRDLFNTPHLIPAEVQELLKGWTPEMANYDTCQKLVDDLEKIGYTCSYGLDAIPYHLRPMIRKINDSSQALIDRVVEQIREDFDMGDIESLEELLRFVPKEKLIQYLPEEEWADHQ